VYIQNSSDRNKQLFHDIGLWCCLVLLTQLLVQLGFTLDNKQPDDQTHHVLVKGDSPTGDGVTDQPDVIASSTYSREISNNPGQHPRIDQSRIQFTAMSARQILQTTDFYPVFETFTELTDSSAVAQSPDLMADPLTQFSSLSFAKANPLVRRHIVTLDPGHGGSDPGTIGIGGSLEKHLTLDIAKRVTRLLDSNPTIEVKLSRNRDRGFSRKSRVRKIKSDQSDLLLSLHFNHLPQRDVTLVESFYAGTEDIAKSTGDSAPPDTHKVSSNALTGNTSLTDNSRQIAQIMQRRIFNVVSRSNPEAINAGVKQDNLYILTRSQTPGALIELTCLSNAEEEARLDSSAYRQEIASAIAGGLLEYFSELDLSSGI